MSRFKRPELSYSYSSLEPSIDAETMEVHHTKHHEAYVTGLNKLSNAMPPGLSLYKMLAGVVDNDGIKDTDKEILFKFGGGHYNHSLFWEYLSSESGVEDISEILMDRIKTDFGSLEELQAKFDKEAVSVFGSGWAWWIYDHSQKKTRVVATKDQMNPVMQNKDAVCLLGLDVWEHAYYLKYQNKRAEYVAQFWNVVNWRKVSLIHDNLCIAGKPLEITDDGYIKFD